MQKVGILGGGQLGRMLLQAAINYPVETYILENDANCPSAHLCHKFVLGDIKNYDDVLAFGRQVDIITIEIENVNIEALEKLEQEGKSIYPRPAALRIIKNKILQKQFYLEHQIPSSEFAITESSASINNHLHLIPGVHKSGEGGYDGKGVELIHTEQDLHKAFDHPAVFERMIDVAREISIIIAKSDDGSLAIYPAVDMIFDKRLNLLSHQLSPSNIAQKELWKAEAMALKIVKELNSPGIFAIELFVDRNNAVWVNETAPRVHNSGHHTIEANYCSQFDMLWRILLGYPLGNTASNSPAAIVNLVGAEGFSGPAFYDGLHDTLKIENVFVHIYGKKETRPGRKMGHVTILGKDIADLQYKVNIIKNGLKVITKS